MIKEGTKVFDHEGTETGQAATGSSQHCRMEGCTGRRITVTWADGKVAYPSGKAQMSLRTAVDKSA